MQFNNIIGHNSIKSLIRASVADNRLSHALILKGIAGIGKLPLALAIAQYVNCGNKTNGDSCGNCSSCRNYQQLAHPDLHIVLPVFSKQVSGQSIGSNDFMETFRAQFLKNPYLTIAEWSQALEAENKQLMISIQEIRNLKKKVSLSAYNSPYKVILIWHVDKIRTEAANAFLKLLEEPPDNTLIIMTVEDSYSLLPTITSRCQFLNIKPLSREDILNYIHLKYNDYSEEEQSDLASLAQGSISKLKYHIEHVQESFTDEFVEWMRACYNGKIKTIQDWTDKFNKRSKEYQKLFIQYALQIFRETLLLKLGLNNVCNHSQKEQDFLVRFSERVNINGLTILVDQLERTIFYLSRNANTQMVMINLSLQIKPKIFNS